MGPGQLQPQRRGPACSTTHQKIDPTAGPDKTGDDYIDWDMWLGHKWGLAPKIPWTPEHFFRFRKYWPYNGGVATDLLYHKLAPLLLAIAGPNGQQPTRVSAAGGLYIEKDGRDIPDTFLLTVDYPSEFSVFLVSTLTNDCQLPDRIYGKHGTMDLGGEPVLRANGDFADGVQGQERRPGRGEADDEATPGHGRQLPRGHSRGRAIALQRRPRGRHDGRDQAGVESYRQSKTMLWDAEKEQVIG